MKITGLSLENFKRFTKLSLEEIPETAKLIVLVGPNGCGKSSIFDAFEHLGGRNKQGFSEDPSYLKKDPNQEILVEITTSDKIFNRSNPPESKSFYIRSAYRVDSDFQTNQIGRKEDIFSDTVRPRRLIDLDKRVQDNYERLVGSTVQSLYSQTKDHLSVAGLREELIGKVRESMRRVFGNLILEGIGDPFTKGQFFFTKGTAYNFPYKNLSAGEKGAFDIILDLIIKSQDFNDTVFVIDEPELHMHSKLQQALLKELVILIPAHCQLWVATHSIGFIKGAIDLRTNNPNEVILFDFDEVDFDQPQRLIPIIPTPEKIRKIFSVALDDLSQMVTPSQIVFCEGSLQNQTDLSKREFDSKVYNIIFSDLDILFFSANNKAMAQKAATFLLKVVTSTGAIRNIKSIVDRDDLTPEKIQEFKSLDSTQKFLGRRTIENYLFDLEIIDKYCYINSIEKSAVTSRLSNPIDDNAKSIQSSVKEQCKYSGSLDDFKLELAKMITDETECYKELKIALDL